jgi:cobalt-zinc-cadmium efflux system outer membrane protein
VGPALRARLPLFDRQQGVVVSRQAELDALRERYVGDAIGIRAAVRAARARVQSSEARAKQYRDTLLPLREQVLQQTVLEYNAMQIGVFQLLQARRDQIETGRSYVATLLEYWKARSALEQLLAGRYAGTVGDITAMSARPNPLRSPAAMSGSAHGMAGH